MEAIKQLNEKISNFLQPYIDKIVLFLQKEYNVVYGVIGVFLAILVLAGLIAMLKKTPKLFIFIVVLLGIIVAVWYFVILKANA